MVVQAVGDAAAQVALYLAQPQALPLVTVEALHVAERAPARGAHQRVRARPGHPHSAITLQQLEGSLEGRPAAPHARHSQVCSS